MHIDGLTVMLLHRSKRSSEARMVRCLATIIAMDAQFDLRFMDSQNRRAIESTVARQNEKRLLDRLIPFKLNGYVRPVVQHMTTVFPYEQINEPETIVYFSQAIKKNRLPIFTARNIRFSLLTHSSLQPYSQLPITELIFDWFPLNQNKNGVQEAARIIAEIASSTSTTIGLGGSLEFWLDAFPNEKVFF